ncbi:YvcK family protein [Patescibacteria group bacterium]|nr:YvcK family protein [Patescibacteria group bacterium]MBU0922886.1 YvcK family protein [Patescibacteria group bacterium]MBU1844508.1 YvcK family protein [Patescibacteria group bacterium]
MKERREKKVVAIGGGTGTYAVLTGLKTYPLELSAVISMCDSGGSTGKLRKELDILPPGDVRRAILALSDLPFARKTLEDVFDFRFTNGKSLAGHSVGNILLAALVQITGSMDRAIDEAARIFNLSGSVYPVTLDKSNLAATLTDGTRIYGESKIDMRNFKLKYPIKKVYLTPKAKIFEKAAKAIEKADLVVLGPGDLYTSIVPTLLVQGMNEALYKSKAKLVYVVNLLTKRGETDDFSASDFLAVIRDYLGDASEKISHVIVHRNKIKTKSRIADWYKRYGSKPVIDDLSKKKQNVKIITGDFMDTTTFYRHDSSKLARTIVSLL